MAKSAVVVNVFNQQRAQRRQKDKFQSTVNSTFSFVNEI
jgi:hypothetical protein